MVKLPTRDDLGPVRYSTSGGRVAAVDKSAIGRGVADLGKGISAVGAALSGLQDKQDQNAEFETEKRFQEFKFGQQQEYEKSRDGVQPSDVDGFATSWDKSYNSKALEFYQSVPDKLKDRYDLKLTTERLRLATDASGFAREEQKRQAVSSLEDMRNNMFFPRASSGEDVAVVRSDYKALIDANSRLTPAEKDKLFRHGSQEIEKAHVMGRIERGGDVDVLMNDIRGGVKEPLSTDENPETRAKPTPSAGGGQQGPSAAMISSVLETGKKNPLEGVANISKDSGGTKSYGNFGLNSGGSVQKFVTEHGDEFGFTEKPGTPEFDRQWRKAAADMPDKLHAAEMDWHSKTITNDLPKRLTNAGVPEQMASDPRVLAYFADRSVQQGTGSIDEMGKHSKRIKAAADGANGDPVKFLTDITEADRGALKSDFPTALATGVYGERGHDTRLNGRLKMALSAGDGTASLPSEPAYSGQYQHLTSTERQSLLQDAMTARKREVSAIQDGIKSMERAAEQGFSLPADQIETIRSRTSKANDAATSQALSQAESMLQWQSAARQATPNELDAFVRQETTRLRTGGATPFELKRLDLADKLLTNMRQELKQDPLGWAERVGVSKIAPLDFSSPEAAQASLGARTKQADEVAARYGETPRYLRPSETHTLREVISRGGDETLSVAASIASAAGSRAPAIIGEVFEKQPSATAVIAGLVAETGAIVPAARDAADALVLEKQKDFRSVAPHGFAERTNAISVLGNSLTRMPQTESAMIAAANLVYETRHRRSNLTMFDSSTWTQGLKEVIGERTIGGETYGGIVDADPSWLGRRNVILPPDVSQSNWRQIIDGLTEDDLKDAGAGLPVGEGGKPIPLSRLKNATLVQTGPGRYALSSGNPDVPGEERWLVRSDSPSTIFEIDFAALKPIMQKRYPDAFLRSDVQ